MQLASSGLRALRGHQPHTLGNPSRSLHTPAHLPRPAPAARPTGSSVQALFRHARTFLSTVAGHLTAPGAFAPPPHAAHGSRSLLEHAHRFPSVQQRLPSATRLTLARPLGAPSLPRAPAAVPRSMFDVGLGTARAFSTARPLFDNLAQNVPVTGRAFWEADWDVRVQKDRERARMRKYQKEEETQQRRARGEMLSQPVRAARQAAAAEAETADDAEIRAELDRYFPVLADEVVTYLLVPLAPTPTARLPLALTPPAHNAHHPLLPLPHLAAMHHVHDTHALRVSTVFARLDAARVFDAPGVSTSAYGDRSGLCTVLEVRFAGWTQARVRGVLGEAGTGWCVLEEVREHDPGDVATEAGVDDALSSETSGFDVDSPLEAAIDPAASFVLPTLDFSASFVRETDEWARAAAPPPTPPGLADLVFHNAWAAAEREHDGDGDSTSDGLSDLSDSVSDIDMDGSAWGGSFAPSRRSSFGASASSHDSWTALGLSSGFAGRMEHDTRFEEPREAMF
ncbi:uncharacterized protein PHACADRAFT_257040 [Phanerochaete carnosa HHB-10118-sp]|uniref:Uncharacterized protein n=1 Tax=Phanerochaete carnosa (strain HHB-10118-sp) TaxID=650164 RepID=K5V0L7_PHACS|nr:uncharacterized protein PHACADRAFT_257040 [Phanerochaete carnosa HHB-10118-sp]EKM56021.1 hypothetical protein PHACADRAFT_257040 [Phanerochaete carnosa HHB-10118-sp]